MAIFTKGERVSYSNPRARAKFYTKHGSEWHRPNGEPTRVPLGTEGNVVSVTYVDFNSREAKRLGVVTDQGRMFYTAAANCTALESNSGTKGG